jgi:hypothetical protein
MVNLNDMKTKLTLLFMVILFAACEIDNYEAPQVTASGRIIDSQTNELVESGGINAGTVVKLYQDNSSQPLIYNTLPDGTFVNSKVFAGNYTYTAEGPFTMAAAGPQNITIRNNSEIEIEVIPNLRLNITGGLNGTTANINMTFEKVATDQKLVDLAVVWSKFRNPNNFTFAGGSIIQENVESLDLISGEKSFTIENLEPNTKYYIRGSARTNNPGNYYNYSTQIELQTQ